MAKAIKVKSVSTGTKEIPSPTSEPAVGVADIVSALSASESDKEVRKEAGIKESTGEFITLGGFFKVKRGTYKIIERNIIKGKNTLLLGDTGVGKTELVAYVCKELGLPLNIFDMGTMTDPITSLVGSHTISVKEGKTNSEFVKSRFSQAIQSPGVVLLDEISR